MAIVPWRPVRCRATYLLAGATNRPIARINEYLRTRRLRNSADVVTDNVPERPAEDTTDAFGDRDEMWSGLTALPEKQRAVLVVRYYESLPDKEIARILGCRGTSPMAADPAPWYALATVIVVVATVLVATKFLDHQRLHSAALSPLLCPRRDIGNGGTVPAPPAGLDVQGRMVPTRPPTAGVVCTYRYQGLAENVRLTRSRGITGGLGRLSADLSVVGRATINTSRPCSATAKSVAEECDQ